MRRGRDVLCTAYLTARPDPQRGHQVRRDWFGYIRTWWTSVHGLGLRAVILHDELSPAFVRRYTTDLVRFVRIEPYPWSPNDQRFFAYRDLIARGRYDRAFLTDVADVRVVRDPFPVLEALATPLVVGDEVYAAPIGVQIRTHPWLMRKVRETRGGRSSVVYRFFRRHGFDHSTLNAGVIGGRAPELLEFLERFVRVRRTIGHPERNLNMPVVNYVLHRFFPGRFHHGAPVTSRFKGYERHRRDVCFIHK
ncbi:MAG: hypothetical protein ACREMB_19605 [Candidatus Rokuibacteriota bacterium]